MVKRNQTKTRKQDKEDKMFIGITPGKTSGGLENIYSKAFSRYYF